MMPNMPHVSVRPMPQHQLQSELEFFDGELETRLLSAGLVEEAVVAMQGSLPHMELDEALAMGGVLHDEPVASAEVLSQAFGGHVVNPALDPSLSLSGDAHHAVPQRENRNDYFAMHGYRMLALELVISAIADSRLTVRANARAEEAQEVQMIREEAVAWLADVDTPDLEQRLLDGEDGGGLTFVDCCEAMGMTMPEMQESFRSLCQSDPARAMNRMRVARRALLDAMDESSVSDAPEHRLEPGEKPAWARVDNDDGQWPVRKIFCDERGNPLNPFQQFQMREQMRQQEEQERARLEALGQARMLAGVDDDEDGSELEVFEDAEEQSERGAAASGETELFAVINGFARTQASQQR